MLGPTQTSKVPSRALRAMFAARYAILITTVLLTCGLAFPAALYPKGVTQDTVPPANSPSAIAKARYDAAFPSSSKMTGFVVFLTNTNGLLSGGVNFGADLDMFRFDYHLEYFTFTGKIFSEEYVKNWTDPLVWPAYNHTYASNTFASFRSTMFLAAVNLTVPGVIARSYLTPGNISTDILLGFPEASSSAASTTFYRKLDAVLPKLMKMHGLTDKGVDFYVVGLPAFMQAVGGAVTDDITRMFSVVVPIALLVFGVSLSSARLLVLPAVSLCVSLMTTMAIMCLVTETMSVNSMSPGIALMMGVALTFDYAYFWASQYRRIMVEHVERNGGQWGELKIRPGAQNPYREKRNKNNKRVGAGERSSTAALLGDSSPTQYNGGANQEGSSGNPSSLANIEADGGDHDAETVVYGGGSGRNDESVYNPNNVDDEDFLVDTMKQLYMTAGKTIVISSITCALCSVGVVFFNVDVIKSIGITAVVTSLCVGITCLIVPATLIMAFPNFFFASLERWFNAIHPDDCYGSPSSDVYKREQAAIADKEEKRKSQIRSANDTEKKERNNGVVEQHFSPVDTPTSSSSKKKKHVSVLLPNGVPGLEHSDAESPAISPRAASGHPQKLTKRDSVALSNYRSSHMILRRAAKTTSSHMSRNWSIFFHLAERFVSLPNSILILIFSIGLILTPTLYAFHPTFSNDIEQFVPRSAPILHGWNTLQMDFPPGLLFTYFILVEFPSALDALSSYPYHHELIATLLARLPNTRAGNFDSQAYFGIMSSSMNPNITLNEALGCLSAPASDTEFCHYVTLTGSIFQNPSATAQYIQIKTDFDPTKGNMGRNWHRIAVDTIQEFQDTKLPDGWTVSLKGYAAETFDTIEYAESALALILACDACIVAFMVFLTFGSVVITLRMCLTVFLTVGASMGLTTLVYCYDSLNTLGWNAISGTGSLAWQVPFASILISFGIAFNYELIVITKIVELRWKAFDTKHSIIAGLAATGREVSVAALIMLIVFFGFVISDVPAMNELGFIFMVTAFIGAFVVRIFTVPSAMGLLGFMNWFPLQYCPARFIPPVMMNADSETDSDGEGRAYYPALEATTEGATASKRQSYHRPHPTFTRDEDVAAERAYEAYRGSLLPSPNASFTGANDKAASKRASYRASYNASHLHPPGAEEQQDDPLYRNATRGSSY